MSEVRMKWKELARQEYHDQQLQDNEGGCGEPVGYITGFFRACEIKDKEIQKLQHENTLLKQAIEKLEKCREFYGKLNNWSNVDEGSYASTMRFSDCENTSNEEYIGYCGKLARQTGKEVEEIMKQLEKE